MSAKESTVEPNSARSGFTGFAKKIMQNRRSPTTDTPQSRVGPGDHHRNIVDDTSMLLIRLDKNDNFQSADDTR